MRFLADLQCDWINAPHVLDQPVNGQLISDHPEQHLLRTLSLIEIVLVGHLSHKRPILATVQLWRPNADENGIGQVGFGGDRPMTFEVELGPH
jgi:hypothetical protein